MMIKRTVSVIFLLMTVLFAARAQSPNQLTGAELRDGWKLLFDGKSSTVWHT